MAVKKKERIRKNASLDQNFSAAGNEEVFIPEADMRLRTINIKESYPGHRFEELGDEFEAEVEIEVDRISRIYKTSWYLREDPPGRVWRIGDFDIHILDSRPAHFLKDRWLIMKVVKAADQISS